MPSPNPVGPAKGDPHQLVENWYAGRLVDAPEETVAALTAFLAPYRDEEGAARTPSRMLSRLAERGASANEPWRDGSHRRIDFEAVPDEVEALG